MKKLLLSTSLLAFTAMPLAVVSCNHGTNPKAPQKDKPTPTPEAPKNKTLSVEVVDVAEMPSEKLEGKATYDENFADASLFSGEGWTIAQEDAYKTYKAFFDLIKTDKKKRDQIAYDFRKEKFVFGKLGIDAQNTALFKLNHEKLGKLQFVDAEKPIYKNTKKGTINGSGYTKVTFDEANKSISFTVKLFEYKPKEGHKISKKSLKFTIKFAE